MNIENVMYALEVMWKGMAAIFIVIFLLTLIVVILTKVTNLPIFTKNKDEK